MTTVTITGTVPQWTINDRLRKARDLTGLSQGRFAAELGVSRSTVKNYERGATSTYKRPVLLSWAVRSGVPLEWLSGTDECAVRDLNPQPADIGYPARLRVA